EDQGEAFGTIFGTAYGWIDDGRKPPPPPVPKPRPPIATVGRIANESQNVAISAPPISTPASASTATCGVSRHRGSPPFGSKHEPIPAAGGWATTLPAILAGL